MISWPWVIESNFFIAFKALKKILWCYSLSPFLELRQPRVQPSIFFVSMTSTSIKMCSNKVSAWRNIILWKSFEPTSKIHLMFWFFPQTPLFFFDSWGIHKESIALRQTKEGCFRWKKIVYYLGRSKHSGTSKGVGK